MPSVLSRAVRQHWQDCLHRMPRRGGGRKTASVSSARRASTRPLASARSASHRTLSARTTQAALLVPRAKNQIRNDLPVSSASGPSSLPQVLSVKTATTPTSSISMVIHRGQRAQPVRLARDPMLTTLAVRSAQWERTLASLVCAWTVLLRML